MKFKIFFLMFFVFKIMLTNSIFCQMITNFNNDNKNSWRVINDDVMGGISSSDFYIKNSIGHFKGNVSLDNFGGFCSARYNFKKINVSNKSILKLIIKGDNKVYQLRVKNNANDYYSYVKKFKTSDEWEVVKISLNEMYPSYRGRRLNKDNFDKKYIEEIAILIGNKKYESFNLKIKSIELE